MDIVGWIAASDLIEVRSSRSVKMLRDRLADLKPRGFLSDFVHRPLVSREKGTGILVSQQSSFFGQLNVVTCKIRLLPREDGTVIQARLWHPLHVTAWFCLSYALAFLLVVAGLVASCRGTQDLSTRVTTVVACALVGVAWAVVTGVFNALLRTWRGPQITQLTELVQSCGKNLASNPS